MSKCIKRNTFLYCNTDIENLIWDLALKPDEQGEFNHSPVELVQGNVDL